MSGLNVDPGLTYLSLDGSPLLREMGVAGVAFLGIDGARCVSAIAPLENFAKPIPLAIGLDGFVLRSSDLEDFL